MKLTSFLLCLNFHGLLLFLQQTEVNTPETSCSFLSWLYCTSELLKFNQTADPEITQLSEEYQSNANAFGLSLDMTTEQIRERMRNRFDRDADKDPSLTQLCTRSQAPSESLVAISFTLGLMGEACLKDIPPDVVQLVLTEHFIFGLRNVALRDYLFEVQPKSLIDAVLVPSRLLDEEFESL